MVLDYSRFDPQATAATLEGMAQRIYSITHPPQSAEPIEHNTADLHDLEPVVISEQEVMGTSEPQTDKPEQINTGNEQVEYEEFQSVEIPEELRGMFSGANDVVEPTGPVLRVHGDLGKILGNITRTRCSITLYGPEGSGKSQLLYDIMDAFARLPEIRNIAYFTLEMAKNSAAAIDYRKRYFSKAANAKVMIADRLDDGFNSIKKAASLCDVVVIDSWKKTGAEQTDYDLLRREFPETIFITIFQLTTQKSTRGGKEAVYDSDINLKVEKVDNSFYNNYMECEKNRFGGETGVPYNIWSRRIIQFQ
jgi:hypothetical protein